jgi:hypothetical protein
VRSNHFDSPLQCLKVSASQHNVYNYVHNSWVLGYSIVSMTHTVQASKPQKRLLGGSGALPHEDRMLSAGLCVLSTPLAYADADMASTVSSRRLIVHEWQDGSKCRSSAMPTVPPAPLTSKAFQAQQATEGRFRSAFLDQPI